MAGYCTSGQIYFREPKASENTAHKDYIQPYSTFTSVIMCFLPTFSALISFTNYHMRTCIIWRHVKFRLVSVAIYHQAVPAANTVCMHAIYCSTGWSDVQTQKIYK